MEQDYDKIRDRELNRHLDQKYGADLNWVEDVVDALKAMRDEQVMSYLEESKNEPAQDVKEYAMDNWGLSATEFDGLFNRWLQSKDGSVPVLSCGSCNP